MKNIHASVLVSVLVLVATFFSSTALAVESGTSAYPATSQTGTAATVQVTTTGSAADASGSQTDATRINCDGQAKPALECPAGYSVQCNPTGGYHWGCAKDSSAVSGSSVGTPTPVPQQASTDAFIKIDGVKGETKSEAATGAMPVKYLDLDDDSDSVPTILEDDAFKASVFIKLGDVKGESEDDKKKREDLGVGLENGDVPNQADFSIMIDSRKVRGWDPKTKEEAAKSSPKLAEAVTDENGLALFVLANSSDDPQMEQISLNFTKIEFKYRSDAKLFGVIPSSLLQDVSLENGAVNLKKPWYSFLFTGYPDIEDLAAAAQATKDKGHKDEIEILSWSFGASNAGSMSAGSGGGAGKVNVASGDVNGDGTRRTFADVATEFSALKDVMKASYDLAVQKK